MLSRTQRVIQQYLEQERLTKQKPKLEKARHPISLDVIFVDERKLKKYLERFQVTKDQFKLIHQYINESPKANQHFHDYSHGVNKKNFVELVNNMTR